MTGNTTLYHLINDSLMPHLGVLREEKSYRILLKSLGKTAHDENLYFNGLAPAFERLNFQVHPHLIKDWKGLAVVQKENRLKNPLALCIACFSSELKPNFFIWLLSSVLFVQYGVLKKEIAGTPLKSARIYSLMKYLIHLEQLMEDVQISLSKNYGGLIFQAYKLVLAYYLLRLKREFPTYVKTNVLRYFDEEVRELFLTPISDQKSHQNFQQQMKTTIEFILAPPPYQNLEVADAFESDDPLEMVKSMQKDIQNIQVATKNLRISAPDLELSNDEYVWPKEAAKILGVSPQTLLNYKNKGKLKDFRQVGNRFEYSLQELNQFKKTK
ncbi:helix-turn-helix domain-containing protein [Lentimicrobium sp. S6]|uniref:helix-turn-helix domain-containing protein n=1 Tax=Lentimicrobium sp. S6 TaxID=2735872 RepID=UPI001553785B|nr:helix-turn-helix domain-containing protein [Lentimicrobium sp. S6]NPD47963.1 MerR family transcriptional regulator [Lentimicrobium sp. S6]